MNTLGSIYGAVVGARNALYERGVLRVRRLRGPVVSVGNLSAGGSGKTPFVILLGQLLQAHGVKFDVLSRGYGRASRGVALVRPEGTAAEFGDEPLLIARRLGVPVMVGESRYEAGLAAEKKFGPHLHLLDDGFQHRGLAREVDIVLVNAEDGSDRLLPLGRLREPLSALRRAHAVVMEGAVPDFLPPGSPPVWTIRRGIQLPAMPLRPIAFCGIARPSRFFHQLHAAGVGCAAEIGFRDHHRYTAADVRELLRLREEKNCGGFVTTEKDIINLGPHAAALVPLAVAQVTMELVEAQAFVRALLETTTQHGRGRV